MNRRALLSLALLPLAAHAAACTPDTPPREPPSEHVYQLDFVVRARDGSYTNRVDVVVGDPGRKELTRFTTLPLGPNGPRQNIEVRTLFHTEGTNILLDVAFEGGDKHERLHDREPLVIPFDDGPVAYDLTVTPARLR